jgi:hypothetical protein
MAGNAGNRYFAGAVRILQDDGTATDDGLQGRDIAAPEAHLMSSFGQVGGGGIAAVAAPQDCDLHNNVPPRPGAGSGRLARAH